MLVCVCVCVSVSEREREERGGEKKGEKERIQTWGEFLPS